MQRVMRDCDAHARRQHGEAGASGCQVRGLDGLSAWQPEAPTSPCCLSLALWGWGDGRASRVGRGSRV